MSSCSAWAYIITSGLTCPTRDAASAANPKTGSGTCGSPGNLGIPANEGTRPGRRPSSSSRSTPIGRTSENWPSNWGSSRRMRSARGGGGGGGDRPARPAAAEGVGKKLVTARGAGGFPVARPPGRPADLLERPANAVGVARELDGAGVGQVLALSRHRRHDQPTEERSH